MNNKSSSQIKWYLIFFFGIIFISIFSSLIRNNFLDNSLPVIDFQFKEDFNNSIKYLNDDNIYKDSLIIDLDSSYLESLYDYRDFQIVSSDTAYILHKENLALFVDVRSYEKYTKSHINNAINIPYNEDNEYESDKISVLQSANRPIVVYCNDSSCSLGSNFSSYLTGTEFLERILYYKDGYEGWESNNYPISFNDNSFNSLEPNSIITLIKDNLSIDDYLIIISIIFILVVFVISYFRKVNRSLKLSLIIFVIKLLLSYIFISYSIDKIINPHDFVKAISYYGIIPDQISLLFINIYPLNFGCLFLPWIELIVGLLLFLSIFDEYMKIIYKRELIEIKYLSNTCTFIVSLLLILFIVMLGIALINGKSIECGCKLSENSAEDYEIKFRMIKRMVVDFYLLGLSIIVKYGHKILRKK